MIINRRKTLVLVNDKNRYFIVLHGLKAKDFKRLDDVIVEAIRNTFQSESIKNEVIESFIDSSKEMTYTKTKNRTMVARMNRACLDFSPYEDFLREDSIHQSEVSTGVSRLLAGDSKGDYFNPNEALYKDLEKYCNKPIFESEAVELMVTLKLDNYAIWRKIVVPMNTRFAQLHHILQATFGWRDSHLHEFYIYDGEKRLVNLVSDEFSFENPSSVEIKWEADFKLSDFLPRYKKITYKYDFGDDWHHEIEVGSPIDDYQFNHAVCLAGEGNAPPEDVGGPPGYEEFLKIISDKDHPDFRDMESWGRSQGFEEFKIMSVNDALKNIYSS